MSFKEKAAAFLMGRLGKTAHVLQVTPINTHLLQIELQLPDALPWKSCQHLKCEVNNYAYRDYTVASYDEGTKRAILLIDAGHAGNGSDWARQLAPGKAIHYMGPGGGFHQPTGAGQLVCIGDASATGHFVSLYKRKHPEQGFHALFLGTTPLPAQVLDLPIHCLTEASLISRLEQLSLPSQDTTFYVAGYIPMVVQIRKLLKQYGWKQIKATGFWE